jgi:hypothetical protein
MSFSKTLSEIASQGVTAAEFDTLDGGITVAKIAGGGTDGQVLTSTGASTAPAFEDAAGGGLIWLQTVTASSDATVLVGSSSLLSATYRVYKIFGSNIHSSNDGVTGDIRISTAGAVSSSLLYTYHQIGGQDDDSAGPYSGIDTDDTKFTKWIGENVGNAAGETSNFELTIYDPASTDSYTHFTCFTTRSAQSTGGFVFAGGRYKSAAAIDGIQFFFTGGSTPTVTSGYFNLYGVSHG